MFKRNHSWLMQSLKTGKDKPQLRLLKAFDLILMPTHSLDELRKELRQQKDSLTSYLTKQAKASGAQLPEVLAQQIVIMLENALQEELQHPGCQAARHARTATDALIHAQCQNSWRKVRDFSTSASFVTLIGISLLISWYVLRDLPLTPKSASDHQLWSTVAQEKVASPRSVQELYNTLERMRQGTCHFPQALMLGESQRSVFLRNVVAGNLSHEADEIKLANQLLEKIQCEYKPLIMLYGHIPSSH